jgi:hypothetical protein
VLRFIRNLKSEPCDRKFGPLSAYECCAATRKAHMKRVIGNSLLTFEEMNILLCQIEA